MPQENITFSFFYLTIKMKMAKQRGLKVTRGLRFLSFRFFIMMWRLDNAFLCMHILHLLGDPCLHFSLIIVLFYVQGAEAAVDKLSSVTAQS